MTRPLDWRDVHLQGPYLVVIVSPQISVLVDNFRFLTEQRKTLQIHMASNQVTTVKSRCPSRSFIGCGVYACD
jgi:hypothetical protein